MNFNEFINGEVFKNTSGAKGYFLFETIVLSFLSEYINLQSKKLFIHYKSDSINDEIDALAPLGIDDLPGGTVIDIRLYKNNMNYRSFYDFKEKVICLDGLSSILFILGTRLNNDEKRKLLNKLNDSKINVDFWDLNDLSHAFKHIDLPEYNVSLLSEILLNTTVNKSITEDVNTWKKERDRRIKKLNKTYLKDDLVLFLGAGISKEAGIPDWNSLISDLLVTMIKEKVTSNKIYINSDEQIEIINSMKQFRHYSPLLQVEYIKTGLGNLFEKELSRIIYDGFDGITKGTSLLLKALARLCSPRRNRIGVRSVITYNFDDLLENHLKEYNIQYKSIYKETDCSTVDELPIYHVHGFLPRNPEKYNQLSESLLVFSEEGYHTLYNEPYSWQNIV